MGKKSKAKQKKKGRQGGGGGGNQKGKKQQEEAKKEEQAQEQQAPPAEDVPQTAQEAVSTAADKPKDKGAAEVEPATKREGEDNQQQEDDQDNDAKKDEQEGPAEEQGKAEGEPVTHEAPIEIEAQTTAETASVKSQQAEDAVAVAASETLSIIPAEQLARYVFVNADKDGNGWLSHRELKNFLSNSKHVKDYVLDRGQGRWKGVFGRMDMDQDGKIEEHELASFFTELGPLQTETPEVFDVPEAEAPSSAAADDDVDATDKESEEQAALAKEEEEAEKKAQEEEEERKQREEAEKKGKEEEEERKQREEAERKAKEEEEERKQREEAERKVKEEEEERKQREEEERKQREEEERKQREEAEKKAKEERKQREEEEEERKQREEEERKQREEAERKKGQQHKATQPVRTTSHPLDDTPQQQTPVRSAAARPDALSSVSSHAPSPQKSSQGTAPTSERQMGLHEPPFDDASTERKPLLQSPQQTSHTSSLSSNDGMAPTHKTSSNGGGLCGCCNLL